MSAGCTCCSQRDDRHGPPAGRLRIAVLGVCGSGKSTLAAALCELGYDARQISQEHSGLRRLWRRRFHPHVLVYLEASESAVATRLGTMGYGQTYGRQRDRLETARREADIWVDTDDMSAAEVLDYVLRTLA